MDTSNINEVLDYIILNQSVTVSVTRSEGDK